MDTEDTKPVKFGIRTLHPLFDETRYSKKLRRLRNQTRRRKRECARDRTVDVVSNIRVILQAKTTAVNVCNRHMRRNTLFLWNNIYYSDEHSPVANGDIKHHSLMPFRRRIGCPGRNHFISFTCAETLLMEKGR